MREEGEERWGVDLHDEISVRFGILRSEVDSDPARKGAGGKVLALLGSDNAPRSGWLDFDRVYVQLRHRPSQ